MINDVDKLERINAFYHSLWIYTLDKYRESDNETGVYFWIKKKDNNYHAVFSYGENGLNIKFLKINEEDLAFVEEILAKDGFKIIITEKNNHLLLINKSDITKKYIEINLDYMKNEQEEEKSIKKMPITPFAETRHKK